MSFFFGVKLRILSAHVAIWVRVSNMLPMDLYKTRTLSLKASFPLVMLSIEPHVTIKFSIAHN